MGIESHEIQCLLHIHHMHTITLSNEPRAYCSMTPVLLSDSLSVIMEDPLQTMQVLGPEDVKRSKELQHSRTPIIRSTHK